jgi:hypothetical protein
VLDAGLSTAAAIEAAGALLQERRDYAMQRQAIIATNAELRERELIKLTTLAAALAETLRGRGVREALAELKAVTAGGGRMADTDDDAVQQQATSA